MAMQEQVTTAPAQAPDLAQEVQEVRELYADAPEIAKTALENVLRDLKSSPAAQSKTQMESAGRIGHRQGVVSELTVIAPFSKGGAKRLRSVLKLTNGNFDGAEKVGTVHDMRFVFLDNDTKMLFATAYDGEWDAYIEDFATKIPDYMDLLFTCFEGWPGIRNPAVKDWIVSRQIPAVSWYVANPNVTVVQTRQLQKLGKAVDELLDKIS